VIFNQECLIIHHYSLAVLDSNMFETIQHQRKVSVGPVQYSHAELHGSIFYVAPVLKKKHSVGVACTHAVFGDNVPLIETMMIDG
jgi:hypothetical protein